MWGLVSIKLTKNGQQIYKRKNLGYFKTEEEAVIVRNKRAQELNNQGATYRIEIYDGPTAQIENNEQNDEQSDDEQSDDEQSDDKQ
jgi:hypothetical protein